MQPKSIAISVVIIAILFFVLGPFAYVPVGNRGIVTRMGAVTGKVRGEGLHLKLPIIEGNKNFEVRVQKEEATANAASKDLQSVSSKVALNFHVEPNNVVSLYQRVGDDYKARLVIPAMQESVKAATAKFNAEELITKRAQVRDEIKIALQERLQPNGILVDDFNIIDFNFSDSFNDSIERKVTAEQDALAAKNKLEQIKFEAEQEIAKSKGKAEAQRIEGEALRANPEVLQLRAVEKWDGKLPYYMAGGQETPFIQIR